MARQLHSYLSGAWYAAPGDGEPIIDPTTGAIVATLSAPGADLAGAVQTARSVGGPALRALTFHERGGLLSELAAYLLERTDEVYAEYPTSGGTLADARIDVEGGIAVLSVYARLAVREFPDDTILAEGDARGLLGNPSFVGQTIYTSARGVMVAINAYNFPVWGMLEKLAPTMLAGLPTIVKPAPQTMHLAEMVARQIIESGILPEGSFQFLAGPPESLLDHLGVGDHISVTGSARTAALLRAHPAVTERGVQFNAEADSLNATILGPDATPGTPEFDLFVKAVVREMGSKAGQKCTAIRRIFVPTEHVDEVVSGVREALGRIVIGDPREPTTQMGPLVSAVARATVEGKLRQLLSAATLLHGGPDEPVAPEAAAPEHAYLAPTLLLATQRRDPIIHSVEAFGPVATVVPFDSPAEAAELAALGEGSLVASVISNDPTFVRSMVREIASGHGRVHVLNRDIARGSTPHGAVLPQLIHGGPGRAGGGEELGGRRGVLHLMQATSVSSSASMSVAITDRWNPAAAQLTPAVHPFRLHLEELRIGDTLHTAARTITLEDIEHFAEFTGDTFYAHMDQEAAAASPIFNGRVAHGYLVLAFAAGLFVDPAPGPVLANVGLHNLRFLTPVYPGDEIKLRLTAKAKTPRPDTGWGEVTWNVQVTNQDDVVCATYDLVTMVASRDAALTPPESAAVAAPGMP